LTKNKIVAAGISGMDYDHLSVEQKKLYKFSFEMTKSLLFKLVEVRLSLILIQGPFTHASKNYLDQDSQGKVF